MRLLPHVLLDQYAVGKSSRLVYVECRAGRRGAGRSLLKVAIDTSVPGWQGARDYVQEWARRNAHAVWFSRRWIEAVGADAELVQLSSVLALLPQAGAGDD